MIHLIKTLIQKELIFHFFHYQSQTFKLIIFIIIFHQKLILINHLLFLFIIQIIRYL